MVDKSSTQLQQDEAREAVRTLGTNAIPFLIADLRAAERAEASGSVDIRSEISLGGGAVAGFKALGKNARLAVPDLQALAQSSNYYTSQQAKSAVNAILSSLNK